MDKHVCHTCNELKIRTEDGYFGKSKNKRYVDENGKLWNGRKCCPDCHKKNAKENMKVMRFNKLLNDAK